MLTFMLTRQNDTNHRWIFSIHSINPAKKIDVVDDLFTFFVLLKFVAL